MNTKLLLILLVFTPASLHANAPAAQRAPCDRHCLLQFLTEYTEALTDNNISRLSVTPTVRVTSNGTLRHWAKGMSGVLVDGCPVARRLSTR